MTCQDILRRFLFCMFLIQPTVLLAGVLEDFPFNDPNGTLLGSAANTANTGNFWIEDDADMTNSAVLNGSYRVQKDNSGFGSNGLDIADITSGTVWMVADFAGWNFTGNVIGGDAEEIRFSFLNNTTADPPGSTITAQVELERIDTDGGTTPGRLEINGQALGSGTNISPATLNLTQSDPFSVVLELDKDANQYSIFYRDGANPFVQLGSGAVDPARNGNTVRMVWNNNFADGIGEFVDLDRFYITDEDPISNSLDLLSIEVNIDSGQTKLLNDSSSTFDIDHYRITSASNSLDADTWNSLDEQNYDAIGGGVGESWDEAGGSDSGVLAELYLLGSSVFDPAESIGIGRAFRPGGTPDLVFEYRDARNGNVFEGTVSYVMGGINGDFDNNGLYECADVDALVAEIAGGTNNSSFDLTGDGNVNGADLIAWLSEAGEVNLGAGKSYLSGDANLDGVVDVPDFNIWNGNKFTTNAAWCKGDFNADGVVDVPDFNAWNGNKFQTSDALAVPEPGGLGLMLYVALSGLGSRRWTRQNL